MSGWLLGLTLMVGCQGEPSVSQQRNLVLIVLDTVRRDHLSAYGYERPTSPTLDRLVAQGTRFDRAWSTSCWTLPAHASMFTGLLPPDHGAGQTHLSLRGRPPLLASLLQDAGYQTVGFSNNPWVSQATGLAGGFDRFDELWREKLPFYGSFLGQHKTVDAVEDWFENQWDPNRPFFLFVNLMEAHGPYHPSWSQAREVIQDKDRYEDSVELYESVGDLGLVRSFYLKDPPVPPEVVLAARDLYDGEIRRADAAAGRVLKQVEDRTDPTRTTVLVVTDHGEHFGEHGHVGHAFSLYEPLVRVAMVARGPGFPAGSRRDDLVQLTDVYPTLLGVAGVTPAREHAGRDLRGAGDPDRALQATYDFPSQVLGTFPAPLRRSKALEPYRRTLRASLQGAHKLILDSNGQAEIYDVLADPLEERPLEPAGLEDTVQALRRVAGQPDRVPVKEMPARTGDLDPQDQEALRELGYME